MDVDTGTCVPETATVTPPEVDAPALLEFKLFEENTIEFDLSTISPEECQNLVITYTLCVNCLGIEVDQALYEIEMNPQG